MVPFYDIQGFRDKKREEQQLRGMGDTLRKLNNYKTSGYTRYIIVPRPFMVDWI